ncbi:MAG TPA: MFS transporter [Pseudonocardiaceae bacterium]|jgi:MFS family permease|nr:MFS transporter [Pseudonocardiaceae bacterium]
MPRRRDLLLVSLGSAVSWFGNSLALIALTLTLRHAGSFAITGLFVAETLPLLLVTPVAGLIADRVPNRRLMILAETGQGVAAVGLALCQPNLAPVFALIVVLSVGSAIARPAGSAWLPVLTGEDGATRGYAWMSAAAQSGLLLGTAAGGVLVTAFGTRTALLIDAATFLVQAASLLLVRVERRPDRNAERGSAGQEIMAGLRLLYGDRVLITVVGGVAASYFAVNLLLVAEVFFVTVNLRGNGIILGVIQAMWMVGALIGSRIGTRFSSVRGIALLMAVCECGMGFALGWPAVAPLVVITCVAYLISGIGNGAQLVGQSALIRLRSPQEMRGRAFAGANGLISAATLLANAFGGLIVEEIGPRSAYALTSAAALAFGLLVLLLSLRLTRSGLVVEQQPAART